MSGPDARVIFAASLSAYLMNHSCPLDLGCLLRLLKQATSPSAFARESPAASSPGDTGSPFALAEVADGCSAAGLRPRTRSRSLLSDKMAEQGGQQEVRLWGTGSLVRK